MDIAELVAKDGEPCHGIFQPLCGCHDGGPAYEGRMRICLDSQVFAEHIELEARA